MAKCDWKAGARLVGAAAWAFLSLAGAASAADPALRPSLAPSQAPIYSFYVHFGPAGIFLSEGAEMTAGGAPVPGGTIKVAPQLTAAVEIGYYFTPNIAVSFTGGLPPLAKIDGAGTLAGLGRLGETRYGPTTLTAHYHFTDFGWFRPYVGLGPTFLFVFGNSDGAVTDLRVKPAIGFAVQAGAEFMLTDKWGVFVDVKKAYLRTEATGSLGGAPIRAKVKLDPLVLHTGVTYRF
jgi:outer membrane protein